MAGIKIHQYPLERTSIGDDDYYDIDYWTGSSYQSAKIKGSTLKNVLGADYIDITTFISGYELTDKDAGKLITNSNTNVRTLVIPSGLALPNNMITVKGRIAIQPETGVNITLPDGSIITDPAQFTCVADEVYILHKSAFSGDDYILVSVKKSENIGTNDLIIIDTIRELQVATDGTFQIVTNDPNNSAIFRVGENSNERFSEIEFNTVIFDLLSKFQNPSITAGVIVEVNPNEFKFIVLPDTSNTSVYHGLIKADANKTIIEKSNAGKFMFDSSLSINTFEDLRATKKGIEYLADYSADFSVRSLVDKGYVDSKPDTNLSNSNLTQTDANRTYDIGTGNRTLKFLSGANEKVNFHTDGGNPTIEAFKRNSGPAIKVNKVSGAGNAFEVAGGTSDFGSNKLINVADPTNPQDAVTLAYYSANMYGGKRYTLIKPNGTKEFYDTLTQVRSNWADGDVLHQFADETDITYVNVSGGVMYDIPSIFWNGNGFKTKVNTVLAISNFAFNIQSSKTVYFFGVNLSSQGVNGIITLRNQSTNFYMDKASFIRIQAEESRGSSSALNTTGTTYGGNVIPEGDALVLTNPPLGVTGSGTCVGVNTSGFQTGTVTNFFSGDTNYPCATNFEHSFCNFGGLAIGNGRTFDHCTILSTRNNNGTANFQTFVARNCTIIHTPSLSTHTFWNIPNIILINCTFITTGYLCASFGGTAGFNIIQGGYYAFAGQLYFAKNNYSALVQISDCTIEATNPSATTDVLDFTNASSTNVKINNVTFKNASGRSDIRTIPANNVEWKNCRFSKGSAHISVSSGTVADAINNNPARLTDPIGYLNNAGNGNWFMYVPMTTAERDALTSVSAGFQIRNTTTNFLQVYNGSTWKNLLDLT